MKFQLGNLNINRLGFGAMRITGEGIWGWPASREDARTLLRRVVELGINFIDTADAYGPETSEYLIQEALHPYDNVIIATKGGLERTGPGVWKANGHPDHLRIACHNSLRRLGQDTIQLYQLHCVDDRYPLEDSLGELRDMQSEGKIQHIGVSNFSVEELRRAREVVNVASVQNRYNLAVRDHDEVVDYCEEHGIAFIPWYPLNTGELSNDPRLAEIAARHGATHSQIALAWLLRRSPVILPIPGTSSVAHLEENISAQNIELDDADFATLTNLA